MSAKITYRKEFFDRDYSTREAYGRVWKYARKYRLRLAVGVVCGMATAGTLVPFFQIVQPALHHVLHSAEKHRCHQIQKYQDHCHRAVQKYIIWKF